jgi:hypothetical protein
MALRRIGANAIFLKISTGVFFGSVKRSAITFDPIELISMPIWSGLGGSHLSRFICVEFYCKARSVFLVDRNPS